jgi:hypothetical protein
MKYIKTLIGSVVGMALLFSVAAYASDNISTNADSTVGLWTLALSGGGASSLSNEKLNNSSIGTELELGHTGKLIVPLEGGIRQGLSYSDATSKDMWSLSTKGYADAQVFKVGVIQTDVGLNAGANYGDQPVKWTAAPEGDLRLWLKKDVNFFGRIEAPFDLNGNNGNTFLKFEDKLLYTLGLQIRF